MSSKFSACVLASLVCIATRAVAAPPEWSPSWSFPDHNGTIFCSSIYNDHLYLGGNFTTIGGIPASCVVEWDGQQYHALGSGLSSSNTSTLAARAMAVYDGKLIVAGNYTTAGGVAAGSVAAWDSVTRTWTTLGPALAQSGGAPADVRALEVATLSGGVSTLYAGGFFNLAGGQPCLNVAGWNGATWNNAGGGYNGTINALESFNGLLYAGGTGSSSNRFRSWDGLGAWNTVANAALTGGSTRINDLQAFGSTLFVGGSWSTMGASNTSPNVCGYDGSQCTPVGTGLAAAGGVTCLTVRDEGMGEGPHLVAAGGTLPNLVMEFDPATQLWVAVAPGFNGSPSTLCTFESGTEHHLFAGGTTFLVQSPGFAWASPGAGINGQFSVVTGLTAGESVEVNPANALFVTGEFAAFANLVASAPDYLLATRTARIAAARYSAIQAIQNQALSLRKFAKAPLGLGLSATGTSCSFWERASYLAFTGGFGSAGGQPARGLAFFNLLTNTWSAPVLPNYSGSIDWFLDARDAAPGARFFGGSFSNTGVPRLDFSAIFDDLENAQAHACAPLARVRGMRAPSAGELEVLRWGDYTATGCPPQPTGYIDIYNLSTDSAAQWPGVPLDGPVYTMCVVEQESAAAGIYAGGAFAAAGATTLNHVARWNGSAWIPLGSGLDGNVTAMSTWDDGEGNNLYVVGTFSTAGGQPATGVARWNGASWSAVQGGGTQEGVNGAVNALAVVDFGDDQGPTLMLGGSFTRAGGYSSGRLAQLVARGTPVIARQPTPQINVAPGGELHLSIRAHRSPPLSYQWRKGGDPLIDGGRISGATTATLLVTAATAEDEGLYSCAVTNDFGTTISTEATVGLQNPCPRDFNLDGSVDPDDLGDYINCYFAVPPCPLADLNGDGEVNPDDLGDYINIYFGGCP